MSACRNSADRFCRRTCLSWQVEHALQMSSIWVFIWGQKYRRDNSWWTGLPLTWIMVSCSVFVRATRWQAGTRIRCLAFSSRRTIRSFGRLSRISSGGIRGMSFGISSGFCSAGHRLMGFGGSVVEIVCNGCVDVRLHWSSSTREGPSSCGLLGVGSSTIRCADRAL